MLSKRQGRASGKGEAASASLRQAVRKQQVPHSLTASSKETPSAVVMDTSLPGATSASNRHALARPLVGREDCPRVSAEELFRKAA